MRVVNMGCIGPAGVDVALDDIVCLVGANNSGKSTVLRAYEVAVKGEALKAEEIHSGIEGAIASVELWVHIPEGAENIDEKWKETTGDLRLVRSRWEWKGPGVKPVRTTWDPQSGEYAEDGKASGLDTVFASRLPQPFRIGSMDDPATEHQRLLKLVLDPIEKKLKGLFEDKGSSLYGKLVQLQEEAEAPVEEFRKELDDVQGKVSESYRRVFSQSDLRLHVSLGSLGVDPGKALSAGSRIEIKEGSGHALWSQQGTGSQRALFWSMLEVRSELNRIATEKRTREEAMAKKSKELEKVKDKLQKIKKESERPKLEAQVQQLSSEVEAMGSATGTTDMDSFLPGYMLLIDEPETALHPGAIRAAKDHLYSLASSSGWQVMLSTHHPAFVDPLKNHTTIVRLHRTDSHASPNVFRSDEVAFDQEERENLQSLLAFDSNVAEMFFGQRVIIVEGDTEFGAFTEIMNSDPVAYPQEQRPLIIRARGKATIRTLVKMLGHFSMNCSVLHDIDSPRTKDGARVNPAYSVNNTITQSILAARALGVRVTHRCSCPNFEKHHGLGLPKKDKPFEAWRKVRSSDQVRNSVRAMLDELLTAIPESDALGAKYEDDLKDWVKEKGISSASFEFRENPA